jgi:cytochrome c553
VSSTKDQTAEIADRIKPYGVVNLSSEPTNFNGPVSAYVVNGSAVQVAVADALPGQAKYAACSACHGGNGEGGIGPMLAGQSVEYIVGRLTSYRSGEQIGAQSALMWGQAANLSDADISDLAEYISTL